MIQAAAIWVGYSTAYGALMEAVTMRPGDRVLIAGASGAVGRAAIQVANQIGAVPLAITRDSAKTNELQAAGAVVVATDREKIIDAVRQHTGGVGADITLDLVRGPGQQELLEATRPGGTLIEAGFLDPRPTPDPGDTSVTVVNYRGFDYLLDAAVVNRMAAFLNAGVRLGALRPAVDTVFDFEDIVEAHRRFEKGANAGRKIVVTTER